MGMKFRVSDLQRDLRFIENIAKRYLNRGSESKLSAAADNLDFVSRNTVRDSCWQIDEGEALWTIPSLGKCEKDGRGKSLQGRLSFVWTMRGVKNGVVELVDSGKASTVLTIYEVVLDGDVCRLKDGEDQWLQKWSFDIVTDKKAPGPGIHAQVSNPKNLPIPRVPTMLFSPADCLDFLLGELFQCDWPKHQTSHARTKDFAASQRIRMQRLLKEQASALEKMDDYSALTTLKNWSISDTVFSPR